MPITIPGFKCVIVAGIPVWKNSADDYFAYETDVATNPIRLGSESEGLTVNWKEYYEERLAKYRESLEARVRVQGATQKGKAVAAPDKN